jgi:hypothetical protein
MTKRPVKKSKRPVKKSLPPIPPLPPLPRLPPLPPSDLPPLPLQRSGIEKWIKKVKRVRLKKGDLLVLRTELILDRDQIKSLRDNAKEQFGKRVVILTAGLDLLILRRE